MKKVIFSVIATGMFSTISFANTPTLENEIDLKKENQATTITNDEKKENTVCVITCSTTVNGVTYTTSAGNWFTSCNSAGNQCLRKLGELSANLAP
jgi:hypothetical protein